MTKDEQIEGLKQVENDITVKKSVN